MDITDTRYVIYRPTGERGEITSWNKTYIFVRFEGSLSPNGIACRPEDLDPAPDQSEQLPNTPALRFGLEDKGERTHEGITGQVYGPPGKEFPWR